MIHQPYANHAQTHTANVEKHTASSQKKDWKYTKMTRKQCAKHTHTQITRSRFIKKAMENTKKTIHRPYAKHTRKPDVETHTHNRFIKTVMKNTKNDTQTIRKT